MILFNKYNLKIYKMIFEYLKKQKNIKEKKKLTQIIIMNMKIKDEQKALYIQALDILDESWIDDMYKSLTLFVENMEIKEVEDIRKNNFSVIRWLKKKEAEEKQKDLNAFSFLLNNL